MKVSIGIASSRQVGGNFYSALANALLGVERAGHKVDRIISVGSMMTDVSRNFIVDDFLSNTTSEALVWVDDDNTFQVGGIATLLNTQRKCITGVYMKRSEEKEELILYIKAGEGLYKQVDNFTTGEIFKIDSAGLGGCVVYREVFEDIRKSYTMLRLAVGGHVVVKNDLIYGYVSESDAAPHDNWVVDGVYKLRVRYPDEGTTFMYHMLKNGLTEDTGFWELAQGAGHNLYVDTSVTIGHIGEKVFAPKRKVSVLDAPE